jgi:hypothetical protein
VYRLHDSRSRPASVILAQRGVAAAGSRQRRGATVAARQVVVPVQHHTILALNPALRETLFRAVLLLEPVPRVDPSPEGLTAAAAAVSHTTVYEDAFELALNDDVERAWPEVSSRPQREADA